MTFPPDLADNHRPIKNTVPSGKMINKNDDKKWPNMLDQWNIYGQGIDYKWREIFAILSLP